MKPHWKLQLSAIPSGRKCLAREPLEVEVYLSYNFMQLTVLHSEVYVGTVSALRALDWDIRVCSVCTSYTQFSRNMCMNLKHFFY